MKKITISCLSKLAFVPAACFCLFALVLSSCATTVGLGGKSQSFATTTIENSTRSTVDAAIRSVFDDEGFDLVNETPNGMTFSKMGSQSAQLIYGGWYNDTVSVEPEIVVVDRGNGTFIVNCDVYMREHTGSELLDANWRLHRTGKGAYKRLMARIKATAEGS